MKKFGYLIGFSLGLLMMETVNGSAEKDQWTWFYQKKISREEAQAYENKKELLFLRDHVEPFTQLLFSWNAVRPAKGYLSFWVQARDKVTKSWGMWHKMIEWGADVQRSFLTPSDRFNHYVHVRLESVAGKSSDAFRIKIKAHDGARIADMKSFAVSLSDWSIFKPEDSRSLVDLDSVRVHKVPKYSQFMLEHPRNDSLCSPTSMSMMTAYLTNQDVDAINFAEHSYDNGLKAYGSWPFNMAHAYEVCNGSHWFAVARANSFRLLHTWLTKNNMPVVVSVRGPLAGAARPYAHGHLMVVIGYDAKRKEVICHDPAFENSAKTRKRYALRDFLEAWERSKRLVYLAGPLEQIQA